MVAEVTIEKFLQGTGSGSGFVAKPDPGYINGLGSGWGHGSGSESGTGNGGGSGWGYGSNHGTGNGYGVDDGYTTGAGWGRGQSDFTNIKIKKIAGEVPYIVNGMPCIFMAIYKNIAKVRIIRPDFSFVNAYICKDEEHGEITLKIEEDIL